MGRPATGAVVEDTRGGDLTFALRFTAYGERRYVTLGNHSEGWTHARAAVELENVLADVRRGIWQPPRPEPVGVVEREIPTFHEFASEWFERQKVEGGRRGGGLAEAGAADLLWRLSSHLLPFFKSMRLDAITVEDVDRYRLAKVRAGQLNATSINKTLTVLAAILETAVEYELVSRNVARGRRRRLPAITPQRTWLDRADHITALLDAAGGLDKTALARHGQRRALLATLTFAGLRIGEALALRWRDVDLARGTLMVRGGKTDAAARTINLLPVLQDEIGAYKARGGDDGDRLVFGTSTGGAMHRSQVRARILAKAVEKANERLAEATLEPIATTLTLHSLRRTYASILFAIGEAPPYVAAQLGHTTPELTLRIYARVMDRRDGEPERLRALVEGGVSAAIGSNAPTETAGVA